MRLSSTNQTVPHKLWLGSEMYRNRVALETGTGTQIVTCPLVCGEGENSIEDPQTLKPSNPRDGSGIVSRRKLTLPTTALTLFYPTTDCQLAFAWFGWMVHEVDATLEPARRLEV